MYERLGMNALPYPFTELPAEASQPATDAPFDLLTFSGAMKTLLENAQGMAGVCCAAVESKEVASQDVGQTLFVLKEYIEAAVVLFRRWDRATDKRAIGREEEEQAD